MPSEPELLLTTSRFRVFREYQPLANGQTRPREIVRHPGAVVIVPLLNSGEVCLIRNYRISVKQTLLELPAGTLEPNEPPIETAGRELIEETGFRSAKIFPLHQFFLSPGILDERMHAFLATGLTAGPTALEAGEEIVNEVVPLEVAIDKIFSGEIQDAKTIASLLMVDHLRRSGQLPQ